MWNQWSSNLKTGHVGLEAVSDHRFEILFHERSAVHMGLVHVESQRSSLWCSAEVWRQGCFLRGRLRYFDHRSKSHDRRATLPQTAMDFNAGASTSVSVRTVQWTIIDMGFRSRRPTHVPLLTARHKALCLVWARQHCHWTADY
ncbi:hypothetical protein AVEN_52124-1 [Araneus ventricosus]|uniref:Transposase Tc1-like domain-containing protein n=1 Tax=Araneus ventricosus TaxID=182803 RepID=A0A4Y2E4W7_ARAVE|nr:hypothetical protein AVEN_52124-1 [Araneus ventricosus]